MAGEEEAQGLFFVLEALVLVHLGDAGLGAVEADTGLGLGFHLRGHGQQGDLVGILFLGFFLGAGDHRVQGGQQGRARDAEAVAGAALDEGFEHALGDLAQVHAAAHVEEGDVLAVLAGVHDLGDAISG